MLKVPLDSERRVDEERLVAEGVVDEVAADFNLRAEAEMERDVVPELGFGEYDQLSAAVGLLAALQVDEAGEGTLAAGEVEPQTPPSSLISFLHFSFPF